MIDRMKCKIFFSPDVCENLKLINDRVGISFIRMHNDAVRDYLKKGDFSNAVKKRKDGRFKDGVKKQKYSFALNLDLYEQVQDLSKQLTEKMGYRVTLASIIEQALGEYINKCKKLML